MLLLPISGGGDGASRDSSALYLPLVVPDDVF